MHSEHQKKFLFVYHSISAAKDFSIFAQVDFQLKKELLQGCGKHLLLQCYLDDRHIAWCKVEN